MINYLHENIKLLLLGHAEIQPSEDFIVIHRETEQLVRPSLLGRGQSNSTEGGGDRS